MITFENCCRSVLAVIILLVGLTASFPAETRAAETQWDSGVIETISGSYIYVDGQRGRHVLEALEDCSWCKEGSTVLVRFLPYVRATIRPFEGASRGRPIKVLVIRDGRAGE